MDKRRNDSYEETHRRLVEAMQEACIHDDFADYPEPDIDISFIYDDVEDDFEEIPAVEVPKKKRFGFTSRFNKVAAILVVLLLTGNIVLLATDSNDSYGHKGLLHRLSETVTGVVTDNDNPVDGDEVVDHHVIYGEEGISSIAKLFPDLYIPSYIPNVYRFDKLEVDLYRSGDWAASYYYSSDEEIFNIVLSYCLDSGEKIYCSDYIQKLESDEIIIYLSYDIGEKKYSIDAIYDDCIVEMSSMMEKNELIKIVSGMKKAH